MGEMAPDLLPLPRPGIEMNSLILEVDKPYSVCKLIISTMKRTSSVYIVISAMNLYLAHTKEQNIVS